MNPARSFSRVIGVGGIGTGVIYKLEGNHTLGRDESRRAQLMPARDFCKQHIILHYVAKLLRELRAPVKVLPVGAVGQDEAGQRVRTLMKQAGMDVRHVRTLTNTPTLFSICLLYPDKCGANLTESHSASGRVTVNHVAEVRAELNRHQGRCLVLAVPEVPLAARQKLLTFGRKHHAFTAASFVTGEMKEVKRRKILRLVDLLAINLDEAAQLAGLPVSKEPEKIVSACGTIATRSNPAILLSVTHGAHGSYSWQNGVLERLSSLKVKVKSTAGAGDAFFAGLLLGMFGGLPFHGSDAATCVRLARLFSAKSVTSPDTIDFHAGLSSLRAFAAAHGESPTFKAFYESY